MGLNLLIVRRVFTSKNKLKCDGELFLNIESRMSRIKPFVYISFNNIDYRIHYDSLFFTKEVTREPMKTS